METRIERQVREIYNKDNKKIRKEILLFTIIGIFPYLPIIFTKSIFEESVRKIGFMIIIATIIMSIIALARVNSNRRLYILFTTFGVVNMALGIKIFFYYAIFCKITKAINFSKIYIYSSLIIYILIFIVSYIISKKILSKLNENKNTIYWQGFIWSLGGVVYFGTKIINKKLDERQSLIMLLFWGELSVNITAFLIAYNFLKYLVSKKMNL